MLQQSIAQQFTELTLGQSTPARGGANGLRDKVSSHRARAEQDSNASAAARVNPGTGSDLATPERGGSGGAEGVSTPGTSTPGGGKVAGTPGAGGRGGSVARGGGGRGGARKGASGRGGSAGRVAQTEGLVDAPGGLAVGGVCSPQVPGPQTTGAPGTPANVRMAHAGAPKTESRAKTQPGKARERRLTGGEDAADKPPVAGNPATMSRAGVKAQPAVRRAGPAPVPGGEDWWNEVEAVSKTAQGSGRLCRDRLFHEKLLSVLEAPLQADAFEHAMLKTLSAALKTVANLCAYSIQPPEPAGVSGSNVSAGKQLPIASVTRKMVAILHLLLSDAIPQLMAQLGGKPPAKLTAELSRTLGLALRKLATGGEGLAALSEDLVQQVVALVPDAMRCTYETAPVVRMYTLEMLAFLGQQAGEQPQHASALVLYRTLGTDLGLGDPISHIVRSVVADGGAGVGMVVGGGQTPHKAGQEVASAVQALADLVHVSSATVLSFPVGEEGGVPLRDAVVGKEAREALEVALSAADRVFKQLVQTPGALDAVLHRARVSDGMVGSYPGIAGGGGWRSGQTAALRLLVSLSMGVDASTDWGLAASAWGEYGREVLALACSPDDAETFGGGVRGEDANVNEVRALLAAGKMLARDPALCAEIAAEDTVMLNALSSRLCTAPDRAVKAAAASALAAILGAAELHVGIGGGNRLRDGSAAAEALGELVQDHGLQVMHFRKNSL